MILTEFILLAIHAVFIILAVFSGILYAIFRNTENLLRTVASLAIALAFIAAVLYQSRIINNMFIYETIGTFTIENPAQWLPFIAIESIAFRGPPAILFSKFKSVALPAIYAPGSNPQFILMVAAKLFIAIGAVAFAYLAEQTVLAERLPRTNLFTGLVAGLAIVGFLLGVYAGLQVDGPLTGDEASRISLINNISVVLEFIPLIAALGLLAYGFYTIYKETGERGYQVQALGMAAATLLFVLIMVISLSPFSLLATAAVGNDALRSLIGIILLGTSSLALVSAALIIAGNVLELLPSGGEEEFEEFEEEEETEAE